MICPWIWMVRAHLHLLEVVQGVAIWTSFAEGLTESQLETWQLLFWIFFGGKLHHTPSSHKFYQFGYDQRMSSLELTLLYLLAAVLGVVGCRFLKLPPMLGYLVVGVVIGPNALALAQNSEGVRHLAEFGVVFLMFVIGLEFNLPKLKAMQRFVFGLGLWQVTLTVIIVTAFSLFLSTMAPKLWGLSWQTALTLAAAVSMSSTAIVIKLMADRLELDSEHGKRVLGVLLFQDLAVVPFLVMIPALNAPPEQLMSALGLAVLKATVLITLLLTGGQRLMRWWLLLVARRQTEELFVLNVLLVTLGLAWLTEIAGLSLALGAFVAGMLISETEFKHRVELDIKPFHDVLLGLFFITIGMMLDWRIIMDRWGFVLFLVSVPVVFKFVLVAALARLGGASEGISLRTGLYLAQAGEFGFVLLTLGNQHNLIPADWLNPVLASMVLSMIATPFIIMRANQWVMKWSSSDWLEQSLEMTQLAQKSINTEKHIIICGYGRCGQNLAKLFKTQQVAYIALDLDPDRVNRALAQGDRVAYGDAARLESLMSAGLERASAVVVTYLDSASAFRVLALAKEHAPHVPVVVRTKDDQDLAKFQTAGASEVVPETIEGSLMLATHALALVGVPMKRVIRMVQVQRSQRYELLREVDPGDEVEDKSADHRH